MAEPSPRILVVDDEEQMTAIISFALETQGLRTVIARDAAAARAVLAGGDVDLVVLDVMMPGESGIELCRSLRDASELPVILLTALGEVDDRVAGLSAGADDYLTKPFSPRELALRVTAVLRRTAAVPGGRGALRCGALRVDRDAGSASWDGEPVQLPETELRLLARLAQEAGRPVPLRSLLRDVWGTASAEGGRDMVKSMVYRLRQQMRSQGAPEDLIEAVRGQGYRLRVLSAAHRHRTSPSDTPRSPGR